MGGDFCIVQQERVPPSNCTAQAIPYLNRLVIKYVYRPIFSQEYSDEVWAKLAGTDPLGR